MNIYQFCWGKETEDQATMQKRTPVWKALRATLGHIPSTHFLMIGGDMNTVTKPQAPRLGTGMLKDKVSSPDTDAMIDIMLDFDLIAPNTFGRMQSYTYIHDGYQQAKKSLVDYILTRRSGGMPSKVTHLRQFPVARRRQGGRHLPVRVHFIQEASISTASSMSGVETASLVQAPEGKWRDSHAVLHEGGAGPATDAHTVRPH